MLQFFEWSMLLELMFLSNTNYVRQFLAPVLPESGDPLFTVCVCI